MSLEFRPLRAEDAHWIVPLFRACGRCGCEYSFTTAFMWANYYDVTVARAGDTVFLRTGEGETASFLPPVGPQWETGLDSLVQAARAAGRPLRLHAVDEATLRCLNARYPGRVRAEESPDDFDYLYRTADLASLPGSAYHAKKNHIAAFSRQYDWRYEPLCDENREDMLALSRAWCAERGGCSASLRSEQCAIRRVLDAPETFSLRGGLIRVEDKAVAFTLGSPINNRVFDIHVEKALRAFSGAYAVINREFAATLTAYEYLNRENDLGIPGLRRAKQSYHPALMVKKWIFGIM